MQSLPGNPQRRPLPSSNLCGRYPSASLCLQVLLPAKGTTLSHVYVKWRCCANPKPTSMGKYTACYLEIVTSSLLPFSCTPTCGSSCVGTAGHGHVFTRPLCSQRRARPSWHKPQKRSSAWDTSRPLLTCFMPLWLLSRITSLVIIVLNPPIWSPPKAIW